MDENVNTPGDEVGATPAEPEPPARRGERRPGSRVHRLLTRLVATGGVIGIGTAVGAIMAANKVQGWIIGLVVAVVSVLLAAVLWSSRQL